MRALLVLGASLLLVVSSPLRAENPEFLAGVDKLLELEGHKGWVEGWRTGLRNGVVLRRALDSSGVTLGQIDSLLALELDPAAMWRDYKAEYAKRISPKEILELLAWYASPVGQRVSASLRNQGRSWSAYGGDQRNREQLARKHLRDLNMGGKLLSILFEISSALYLGSCDASLKRKLDVTLYDANFDDITLADVMVYELPMVGGEVRDRQDLNAVDLEAWYESCATPVGQRSVEVSTRSLAAAVRKHAFESGKKIPTLCNETIFKIQPKERLPTMLR